MNLLEVKIFCDSLKRSNQLTEPTNQATKRRMSDKNHSTRIQTRIRPLESYILGNLDDFTVLNHDSLAFDINEEDYLDHKKLSKKSVGQLNRNISN